MRKKQAQIIADLQVRPEIDPQAEIRKSVDFMKDYLKKYSFMKGLVLGVSGGQDSTLAGKLAQMAITELRSETGDSDYQFTAVRLPYGVQVDESDALAAIEFMEADSVARVDIKPSVDEVVKSVESNSITVSDFNKGNIKARQRMIAQYAISSAKNAAVVGTDHAAEAVTGFYTKFGDGAADITPLWRLDKRQGRKLLEFLEAPVKLYEKTPTADLEDDRPALPDEVALGVSYKDIDDYLEGHPITDASAEIIEGWYAKTAHKRHTPINVYDQY